MGKDDIGQTKKAPHMDMIFTNEILLLLKNLMAFFKKGLKLKRSTTQSEGTSYLITPF
jgi:hypothetical protein